MCIRDRNCTVYENVPQRSEAWFKLRSGRLTASNFDRLLTPTGRKTQPKNNKERGPWGALIIELCCSFLRPDEIQWAVSYTHLDVYKRQTLSLAEMFRRPALAERP